MKLLKKILFTVFCLPVVLLFGVSSPGTGEAKDDEDQKQKETTPGEEAQTPAENGLPQTQEELDALIEKRLARERKKLSKPQTTPPAQQTPPAGEQTPTAQPDNSAELTAARREAMTARVQLEAVKSGIRADVAEDAVYLAMREAEKDGDPDEESINDALKSVLKRHPEWKQGVKPDNKPGFQVGAEGQQPNVTQTSKAAPKKRWNKFN